MRKNQDNNLQYYDAFFITILIFAGFFVVDPAFAQEIKSPIMFKIDPKITIITSGISITSSSSNISEKESVIITGKFVLGGKAVPDRTITLIDKTTNLIVDKTITDKDGQFTFTLNPAFREMPYTFIASHTDIDSTYTSNTITLSVLPSPPTLNISNKLVVEGYPVTFYGDSIINGEPQVNIPIQIVDKTHNTIIGTTTTDASGKYSFAWIPKYNNLPYEFYAVDPFQKFNNISDILKIQVNKVSFTLETSTTNVIENNPVVFSGNFLIDGKPVLGLPVTIFEATGQELMPVESTVTDDSGMYSVLWNAVFVGQTNVFFASITQPTESITPFSGFEFQSNLIKLMVQKETESIMELTLQKLPPTLMEGDIVEFSGNARIVDFIKESSTPIPNIPVCIFDEVTNHLVSSGFTDENGVYNITWNSVHKEDVYSFYAAHFQDCNISKVDLGQLGEVEQDKYFWTNSYKVVVYDFPELVLNPIPEAIQGDIIDLVGFTVESLAGQQVNVIIEGQTQFFSTLDDRGILSLTLDSAQSMPGNYKVYLQCPCKDLNLQSNTQIITINPRHPLTASIVPLTNEFGAVPTSITFESDVTGGSPPYQFSWYIDKEMVEKTESFTQSIAEGDAYVVTLIVIDSAGTRASDVVSVSTDSQEEFQSLVVVMEMEGELAEGMPLTFRAIVDSKGYPFEIEEIIWNFGDTTEVVTHESEEVTKTFEENGLYEVVLSVVDEKGLVFSDRKELFIENEPPQILPHQKELMSFEGTVTLEARFTDPGIKDTFTINWMEEDRIIHTSQQKNPGIVFAEISVDPGSHIIKLEIFDDDGSSDSTEFAVTEYVLDNNDFEYPAETDDPLLWIIYAVVAAGAGISAIRWYKKSKKDAKRKHPAITVDFRGGIKK